MNLETDFELNFAQKTVFGVASNLTLNFLQSCCENAFNRWIQTEQNFLNLKFLFKWESQKLNQSQKLSRKLEILLIF